MVSFYFALSLIYLRILPFLSPSINFMKYSLKFTRKVVNIELYVLHNGLVVRFPKMINMDHRGSMSLFVVKYASNKLFK